MDTTRRTFLRCLTGAIAAPAVVVTPGLLMPVKALPIITLPLGPARDIWITSGPVAGQLTARTIQGAFDLVGALSDQDSAVTVHLPCGLDQMTLPINIPHVPLGGLKVIGKPYELPHASVLAGAPGRITVRQYAEMLGREAELELDGRRRRLT